MRGIYKMLNVVNNLYVIKVRYGNNIYLAGNGGYLELARTLIKLKKTEPSFKPSGVYMIDSGEMMRITKKDMISYLKSINSFDNARLYDKL